MAEYKTTITKTEDGGSTITSGNMTKQEAARLAAERERTKNMNTSDSASAASDALAKDIAAKKRYTEMQNILASGKHKSMSDEEKEAFVKEYKKLKLDYSFVEGGVVPMNNMAKQMDMFNDGGLMDEGGTVDPVSGNDVPPGSTQEEVRDDIPAQLSEGEFVFPADVVRYFGLEKLMEMRQEAKMGLQRMDDMGQMGNSEEAIMPDNLPFDIDDIDMEDDNELEMNIGGLVNSPVTTAASNALGQAVGQFGTVQTPNQSQPLRTLAPVFPAVVVYGPDGTSYTSPQAAIAAGVTNYTMTPPTVPTAPATPAAPAAPAGQAAAPIEAASAQFQPAGTKFTPTTIQKVMPTFKETIGMGVPYVDYDPNPQDETEEETESPSVDTTTTTQQPQGDGGGGDSLGTVGTGTATVGSISDAMASLFGGDKDAPKGRSVGDIFESATNKNNYFGGSKDFGFGNEALRNATLTQAGAQVGGFGLTGMVTAMTKELGITDFSLKDIGVAGFTGMNNALNSLGLTNRGQLMNSEQATLVGSAMSAGHVAARKGQDVQAAINGVLNSQKAKTIQNKAYEAIKGAYAEKAGARGTFTDKDFADEMARVERSAVAAEKAGFYRPTTLGMTASEARAAESDYRSNVVTDKNGNPVTSKSGNVLTEKGKARKEELEAIANQARVNKVQARKVEEERQRKAEEERQRNVEKAEARAAKVAAEKAAAQQTAAAAAAQAKRDAERAEAEAADFTGYGDYSSEDRGSDSDGPAGNDGSDGEAGGGAQGGGYGGGTDCLTEDMKVKLNGVVDFVTNIKVGDIIDNYRVKEVLHKHMRSGYYAINNELKISNDHPVLANGTWTRPEELVVGDSINGIPVSSLEYVERMTPTVSIVIDGESFDVHTENNIYTVHGRYREVRQEAA